MDPITVTAPVEGFCGTVAGVEFVDGVGTCTDANALAYFQRQGYTITGSPDAAEAPEPPPRRRARKATDDAGDAGEDPAA